MFGRGCGRDAGNMIDDVAARAVRISKTYGRGAGAVTALNRVSVEFARARFTAVMGPSGSGKSTLLHCMAGLDTVDEGVVEIAGTDLAGLDERGLTHLRRDRIGFIFQSFNLLPTLTAADNIRLPLTLAGRRPERAWFERLVDAVGLRDRLGHKPAELSGGQQQRVAAARALAAQPAIVFADEPTGNLDSAARGELLGFLRHCVDHLGQTIVMVTHDPVAAAHADRALFLADGHIAGTLDAPTAERVLDRMKSLAEVA
jgi:putative ABC transport system ATP-binding protein